MFEELFSKHGVRTAGDMVVTNMKKLVGSIGVYNVRRARGFPCPTYKSLGLINKLSVESLKFLNLFVYI